MSQFQECALNIKRLDHYLDQNTNIWYTTDGCVVTTLQVTLDKGVKRAEIFDYFSGYGEVQNVQIFNNISHHSGFVTFTQAESVTQVLAAQCHSIPGHITKVAIADIQPHALELPIQLTNNSTNTHLLDLNDDCLLEILSIKSLSVMDLCSIARTSVRLWDINKRFFSKNYKICDLTLLADTISEEKRTIITFGPLISELSMCGAGKSDSDVTSVLDLVALHCSGTLESLRLSHFHVTDCVGAKLVLIFKNLQKLHMKDCSIVNGGGLLVELRLDLYSYPRCWRTIMENTFPKLERFKSLSRTVNNLELENVKVIRVHCGEDFSATLPVIGGYCKQLEEFAFNVISQNDRVKFNNAFMNFQCPDHLRKEQIHFYSLHNTKLILNLTSFRPLESLCLFSGDTELMPDLSELRRLLVLKSINCSGLHQLTKLSIRLHKNSDVEDLGVDLVDIIKPLIHLKSLELQGGKFESDTKLY